MRLSGKLITAILFFCCNTIYWYITKEVVGNDISIYNFDPYATTLYFLMIVLDVLELFALTWKQSRAVSVSVAVTGMGAEAGE